MKPDQINQTSAPQEKKSSFSEFIKLGQELTLQEAVDVFTKFHSNSTQKAVLDAFMNLRLATEQNKNAKVVFSKAAGLEGGILSMKIFDENGKYLSDTKVNEYSGQPVPHWS